MAESAQPPYITTRIWRLTPSPANPTLCDGTRVGGIRRGCENCGVEYLFVKPEGHQWHDEPVHKTLAPLRTLGFDFAPWVPAIFWKLLHCPECNEEKD